LSVALRNPFYQCQCARSDPIHDGSAAGRFPKITVLERKPEKMEPGYTLFRPRNHETGKFYVVILDNAADVVWYTGIPSNFDVRQLANGNLLFPFVTYFAEVNLLGETVRTWELPSEWSYHHEAFPTLHSTFLYLSTETRLVENFPTSATEPDPPRETTLIHHLNVVMKFTRAGELKWILGPHENWAPEFQPFLLTPVDTPFEWQYAQHAPMITPQGTLLLFDNGNHRASPPDPPVPDRANYSRAVEYHINEETMEVSQVWEYGGNNPERIYSGSRGDADWLSVRGNVLITFADISFINGIRPSPFSVDARMTRIIEVTHDAIPEVVFDIAVFDFGNENPEYEGVTSYRARRIPDLYPTSVGVMSVSSSVRKMSVAWNAAPGYTYRISTSEDLVAWEPAATIVATNATMSAELDLVEANQFIRVERLHALQ